jgi:hypothetical protein
VSIARPLELFIGDQVRLLDTPRLMTIYDFENGYRIALCNYLVGPRYGMRKEAWPVEQLRKVGRVRPC